MIYLIIFLITAEIDDRTCFTPGLINVLLPHLKENTNKPLTQLLFLWTLGSCCPPGPCGIVGSLWESQAYFRFSETESKNEFDPGVAGSAVIMACKRSCFVVLLWRLFFTLYTSEMMMALRIPVSGFICHRKPPRCPFNHPPCVIPPLRL